MDSEALSDLGALFGARLSTSRAVLDAHAQSESLVSGPAPEAVVFPETTEEVAALAALSARHGIPLTAWGAGTSLEGHALAQHGGVTVDFSRMDRVLEIRPEDMTVRIQPGLTRERLNQELRATGLFFPVDPGANASLGGMVSTRASGTTAVRYGTMRDNVRGLEVVLAGGEVIRTGSAAPKSSSGYDLTALFTGAEGTLGLITEITLQLAGQPEAVSAATCTFPSMGQAVACVIDTIQAAIPVARIEFLDAATVAAVNGYSKLDLPLEPMLLVEFHGTATSVTERAREFGELAAAQGCTGFRRAEAADDRNRLWTARHRAYPAILASRPGSRAIVTDVCVPISRLAEAVEETAAEIAASGIPGPILGHVGDGNFHAILMVDRESPEEVAKAKALARSMAERSLRLGGTISGEHGIGSGKRALMPVEHGAAWALMGRIKQALDPQGLMNPGKLVP